MRASILVAVAIAMAPGCQSHGDDRQRFDDDGFSIVELSGWTASRERGTVVLRSGDHDATLAVRSMPLDPSRPKPALADMTSATETVLKALRGARVVGPDPREHDRLAAAEFIVGFEARDGRNLDRRHVVLLGAEHVFHAFVTAPSGSLPDTEPVFAVLVSSLREL